MIIFDTDPPFVDLIKGKREKKQMEIDYININDNKVRYQLILIGFDFSYFSSRNTLTFSRDICRGRKNFN